MREKLVRNTSNEKWRTYWEAVHAAATNAPTLRYQEKKAQGEHPQRPSAKKPRKPRKEG